MRTPKGNEELWKIYSKFESFNDYFNELMPQNKKKYMIYLLKATAKQARNTTVTRMLTARFRFTNKCLLAKLSLYTLLKRYYF